VSGNHFTSGKLHYLLLHHSNSFLSASFYATHVRFLCAV
jgi:hypothetical protein